MNKQKIIDYIEELERKAQDSERYFKLWHKEYHKNKQAVEYIEEFKKIYSGREHRIDMRYFKLDKLLEILKGED